MRTLNRLAPRFILPLVLDKRHQLGLFVARFATLLKERDLHVLDLNLWMDGGRSRPTAYHNDLWFPAPLKNRVVQLWIPLMCEGAAEEIEKSMLRVDPRPLPDGWACPPGLAHLADVSTGDTRPLPFAHEHGVLAEDLKDVVGGRELRVGDVLFFDSQYCHYTLASRARRVGLAVRFSVGAPVYNGYFCEQRPLDGRSQTEHNRRAFAAAFAGAQAGEVIDAGRLVNRFDHHPPTAFSFRLLRKILLGAVPKTPLLPQYEQYAEDVRNRLTSQLARAVA
ncbi:uncharacterized protein SOCE26_064690 [Sorangium cellulosum]|uniref:Phytanoyl-CoA dioxygenase n=2 Tax=Sorangium cellulosum TaxID=56 RepID=A0A2L0F0C3_SORCE|nr:uncharacterized protein SOCE26_064690 [Sorangium cellulosum]